MPTSPSIPAFRLGVLYDSLNQVAIDDCRGGEPVGTMGLVNAGVVRRDLRKIEESFACLQALSIEEMIAICGRAAELFMDGDLFLTASQSQTAADYVRQLSASSGLPHALIRSNMEKIAFVLREVRSVVNGLTRGLPFEAIEQGILQTDASLLSFYPATTCLGAVLPSNSPGVNSLWVPALALRIPVMLKPGKQDPWTPWRMIQALIAGGCPSEAFGYYPTDHEGSNVLADSCGRVILFGDAKTVARHAGDPRVSCHGPGYSKIVMGEDCVDEWPRYVNVLADSMLRNSGRSCVNASTIVVPRHGAEIAKAIAEQAIKLVPRPLEAADAGLAGFTNAAWAEAIDELIEQALEEPGAVDVSAALRGGNRLVSCDGISYLHPTVVHCADSAHSLAKTEYMFPFCSVVQMPQAEMAAWVGPSLVVSAITDDVGFRAELLQSAHIDRLNLGPIPTPKVAWDQPHEGNLFEFLYARRAIQEQRCG
ncbi:MAG TPA: aldehyde dehydrogenase [Lentisphaeria bacterium]|jgi:acyl-CoA reductase-like NAD-dependent aldehyde dehydrogenase|nr:aldehyde dehydrogenase [Lentisphaeria bacterium]